MTVVHIRRAEALDAVTVTMSSVAMRHFYSEYLLPVCKLRPDLFFQLPKVPTRPKLADIRELFADVFSRQDTFDAFYNQLPHPFKEILYRLTWWSAEPITVIERDYKITLKPKNSTYFSTGHLPDEYQMFYVQQDRYYNSTPKLALSERIGSILKHLTPKPRNYYLTGQDEKPSGPAFCFIDTQVGDLLKMAHFYVTSGSIKISANTGQILKRSLTNFKKSSSHIEFFNSVAPEADLSRTEILLRIMLETGTEIEFEDPLLFLRQLVTAMVKQNKFNFGIALLGHLKGVQYAWYTVPIEIVEYFSANLSALFQVFPLGKWVSIGDIFEYMNFRELVLHPCDPNDLLGIAYYSASSRWYGSIRTTVNTINYSDSVLAPLVKGIFFCFASLGLVDLAYDSPLAKPKKDEVTSFISIYDNLRYVRINDLGAYALERADQFTGDIGTSQTAKVSLDSNSLIATLTDSDPIKMMALEKFGKKVGKNRYMVDFGTFLADCSSKADVKQKIDQFKRDICGDLPPFWQDFFGTLTQRTKPMTPSPDWEVFQIEPVPELIALLTSDPILRSRVLKAEGHHILIAKKDRSRVIKRLEGHGFLI